jgi:(heptosyl)LPS beta-1,4-glucosyltransferase
MNHKLSVVIITFNEERNIERAIASVQNIADEIIVVDSFSTDKTKEICSKYSVQFIERAWEGYSSTKNFANSLAVNEFILSLDADEALSPELEKSIVQNKENGFSGAYRCNRLTNYIGKWIKRSGWYPDSKVRIFPKSKANWEGAFVHEELVIDSEIEETLLKGDLYHYSYYSYADHQERADKYSILTAQKFHDKGKNASVLKPYLSALARFITMYFFKLGCFDGGKGFMIAFISAKSNVLKYKELRRLNKG